MNIRIKNVAIEYITTRRRTNIIKLGGYPSDDDNDSTSESSEEMTVRKNLYKSDY